MDLQGATALVTGSNRGLGRVFAVELLRRGARVYATARRPELVDVPGAEVLPLDITDPTSVEAAAAAAGDVDVLVNNAAFMDGGNLVAGDLERIRLAMESSYFGTLAMIRAFAPVLARNGGGAVLNVLSGAAWQTVDGNSAYAAAKAAQWSLTNAARMELAGQGTQVTALVPGMIDTEPMREFARVHGYDLPEGALDDPANVVAAGLDGLEAGEPEVVHGFAVAAKAALAGPPAPLDVATATA
ncbi:SDR family NAD(P)-dependent oxidoreductase [Promicromonospora thailandica]|uniref:Short-chain dehydrogenase n=1 Tax=Promicromonospora thailandica TaxID=765201 RepID=A0A9X2G4R3_9MICO|nr:SDR family NAD(P)-dependent oxidoreductase [Promicromonospora thailandica]MCP2267085.1 Short-chain dehydrogenase [Promicromonospora thailandica]BFF16633.1 SDR family NAD(P)-dependent oxidoreductase [Promicromonospora thailandica]